MIKVSFFKGAANDAGQVVFPLFHSSRADSEFEKRAESVILPDVAKYISRLKPIAGSQYVLVNAMGAGEFYGSNINGDHFPEAALIHCPDQWYGIPDIDKLAAKEWPYGFPTFYNAHPFLHHRNKDASRAYGEVEMSTWNPRMKRVELIIRVDKDKCEKFGGTGVWDKIKMGQYPDVSMGSKVPFDTCFSAGTLVRTNSGHVPIEDVRVGDLVLTDRGLLRTVTKTMRRAADDVLRIAASGLPSIDTTSNHPFLVVRKEEVRTCKGSANGTRLRHSPTPENTIVCRRCNAALHYLPMWIEAGNIHVGDYLAVPALLSPTLLDVTLSRARVLGYYLGDGYIIKQRSGKKKDGAYKDMGVGFSVGTSEQAHLQRLLDTLVAADVANPPSVYEAGCDRKAVMVNVYDQGIVQWLQTHAGRTSHGKRLGEEIFCWSREAKFELVGGYIDTDGSFDARGHVRIASVNRGLLLDVQRLLLQEGVIATVCFGGTNVSGFGAGTKTWYLVLAGAQAQKLLGRSVKIRQLDVAHESAQSFFWEGYWLTPVKAIEALEGEAEVFNLSVDEHETYVAEGRIVHNCSICLDWDLYRKAQQTFDSKKHKHAGDAVLAYHRRLITERGHGIRGLSITRKDYCDHASKSMNKILPDGRKIFVYNDYPRFFDISFVFIGADKTAKVMLKVASDERVWSFPSADLAEHLGYDEQDSDTKVASVDDDILKMAFLGKNAKMKRGEIEKHGPTQFDSKAIPLITKNEPSLSRDQIDELCEHPLNDILSSSTSMGMVLRPREFQRIIIIKMGLRPTADDLDHKNIVFPKVDTASKAPSLGQAIPGILSMLGSLFSERSALSPALDKRITLVVGRHGGGEEKKASSHPTALLNKIGSAYAGYRQGVMDYWMQDNRSALEKTASSLSAHTFDFLKLAYWNEVGKL